SEGAVTDAVNDTLKAISASLLMEQVLAPRFNFTPKLPQNGPVDGFDYGEGGYYPEKENVGFNEQTGQFQIEIIGLAVPKSLDAQRICRQDLNEVIAAFVQDKQAIERGLFDKEIVPQELTQIRMGKIIKDRYPELDDEDVESVRQHAIAALNFTQKAKETLNNDNELNGRGSTALIDGVRRFTMDVRDLDVDWIDSINPFSEAYAILSKAMTEQSLKAMAEVISSKKINLSLDEARDLAKRALKFKNERGRLPDIKSADPWEQRMAQGIAHLARLKAEERNG
ncbi:MAG: DEAD/DEAH box helicase, partial [Sphingobacteriales bacterium]